MRKIEACLAMVLVALLTATATAGDCCEHCGCNACVRKVCHMKCEMKKVPKTCYSCECEDFCVPGPSKRCGCKSDVDCNGCEICKPNYVPTCAEVHTRRKLVKKVVMQEEMSYKWCVEYLCDECAQCVAAEGKPRPSTPEAARQPVVADGAAEPQPAVAERTTLQQPVAAESPRAASARPVSYQRYWQR